MDVVLSAREGRERRMGERCQENPGLPKGLIRLVKITESYITDNTTSRGQLLIVPIVYGAVNPKEIMREMEISARGLGPHLPRDSAPTARLGSGWSVIVSTPVHQNLSERIKNGWDGCKVQFDARNT